MIMDFHNKTVSKRKYNFESISLHLVLHHKLQRDEGMLKINGIFSVYDNDCSRPYEMLMHYCSFYTS